MAAVVQLAWLEKNTHSPADWPYFKFMTTSSSGFLVWSNNVSTLSHMSLLYYPEYFIPCITFSDCSYFLFPLPPQLMTLLLIPLEKPEAMKMELQWAFSHIFPSTCISGHTCWGELCMLPAQPSPFTGDLSPFFLAYSVTVVWQCLTPSAVPSW